MSGRILVGTSSWADPGFVKEWYPPKLPAKERLPWYAQRFELVELNSSFYAVPDRSTVHGWVEVTPPGFTFDVKVHRALSRHSATVESLPPDLRELAQTAGRGRVRLTADLEIALAERLVEETAPLADAGKLGSYLLQLTPAFSPARHQLDELDRLVEAFGPHRLAVELRNRNWVDDRRREATLDWFADRGVTYVTVDAPPADNFQIMPSLDAVTNPSIAYMRAHGRNTKGYLTGRSVAERFAWRYTDDELQEIAGRARTLAESAGEVHVAFNNNRGDDAPTAAQRFRALLGQEVPEPDDPQLTL
jgi:uncharacterized protein YecE (DUF72 family)